MVAFHQMFPPMEKADIKTNSLQQRIHEIEGLSEIDWFETGRTRQEGGEKEARGR